MITIDELKRSVPAKLRNRVDDEFTKHINQCLEDDKYAHEFRENFIAYMSVLQDGRYSINQYLNAVKYCTFKLMGYTNQDSYIKTFPDRYKSFLENGYTAKDISAQVSLYNKRQLVNAILQQSMIPTWIINQDLHQKAINTLADLMMNANSEKVKCDSANALLNHLKPPEVAKVEVDMKITENKEITELKSVLAELSAKQLELLDKGVVNTKQIAETRLVGGVYEEQ